MNHPIPFCIFLGGLLLFVCVSAARAGLPETEEASVHFTPPIDLVRLRDAIAKVEASHGKTGRHGERGDLQFKSGTIVPTGGRVITGRQLELYWCESLLLSLDRIGRKRTVYLAALLHNAGATAVQNDTVSEAQGGFAVRVQNVYFDKEASGQ